MLIECTTPDDSNPTTLDLRDDRQIPRPFALYETRWVTTDAITHPEDAIAWGFDTPRAAYVFLRSPLTGTAYLGRYRSVEQARELLSRHGELAIVWPEVEAVWPGFILDDIEDIDELGGIDQFADVDPSGGRSCRG
ncbi:hypothetical protein [Flindersiella endophytica]